jgi:hypothetical protein
MFGWWVMPGWPAFGGLVVVLRLMVGKPTWQCVSSSSAIMANSAAVSRAAPQAMPESLLVGGHSVAKAQAIVASIRTDPSRRSVCARVNGNLPEALSRIAPQESMNAAPLPQQLRKAAVACD